MQDDNPILQRTVKILDKIDSESQAYLFGSQARGDAKLFSDWDILILLNRDKIPFDIEVNLMDIFYELELETGEIFSPIIYSKKDWNQKYSITPLYEIIKKEGIKIK